MNGTGRSRGLRAHHATHLPLLPRLPARRPGRRGTVDGIVVPTHRPASYLALALALAVRLRCPVVAVCGGESDVDEVLARASASGVGRCYVVREADAMRPGFLPDALRGVHEASRKQRSIAAARNLGLAVARAAGWSSLLFLDDDVRPAEDAADRTLDDGEDVRPVFGDDPDGGRTGSVADAADRILEAAARADARTATVGWRQLWFPDNSVVCHANRLAGNVQGAFVGGTLLVRVDAGLPYFPPVYNEDWLFLFDLVRQRRVVFAGDARQLPFDPFADRGRAVDEEFGDLCAEALFHLLHLERSGSVAGIDPLMVSVSFWENEIESRRGFVEGIVGQLADGGAPAHLVHRTGPALASLEAAAGRLAQIRPADVVTFVTAWREDVAQWGTLLRRLHPVGSLAAAFDVLHVPYETTLDERTA